MLLIIVLGILVAGAKQPQDKFDYLRVKGNTVESVHRVRHRLKVDRSFKLLGEYHHRPTYGGKLFNVSVAAFAKGDRLVMVHAKAHADNSGGLDYGGLKPDPLGGINFTSREQCAVLAEIPDPYGSIPDLRFLRDGGFAPAPAMFLKQYLVASPDGSAEYVLTYGSRVASCREDVITPEFKAGIEREVRAFLKIKK